MNLAIFAFVAIARAIDPSCNIESVVQSTQENMAANIACQKSPKSCQSILSKRSNGQYTARNLARASQGKILASRNLDVPYELKETNSPTKKQVGNFDPMKVKPAISETTAKTIFALPKEAMANKEACAEMSSAYNEAFPAQKVNCQNGIVAWSDDPAPKLNMVQRLQADSCCANSDNRPNATTCASFGIAVIDNAKAGGQKTATPTGTDATR